MLFRSSINLLLLFGKILLRLRTGRFGTASNRNSMAPVGT
jgi:hypothetical protein